MTTDNDWIRARSDLIHVTTVKTSPSNYFLVRVLHELVIVLPHASSVSFIFRLGLALNVGSRVCNVSDDDMNSYRSPKVSPTTDKGVFSSARCVINVSPEHIAVRRTN